ncbi:hypothetical protein I551_5988 [Mycobacterium ulcerans str. Harvey]|uniref:Uncharacterized protein n=1 Tax=Mycobacterium ulcerans str. Harvey TaxID=1299332 RepID=A0ABP3A9L6_MYCUL|nr:hypothetical protein I551_5988 [Mycobacterium ulcerans str. Harvey]
MQQRKRFALAPDEALHSAISWSQNTGGRTRPPGTRWRQRS